jgi:hypothetical protein
MLVAGEHAIESAAHVYARWKAGRAARFAANGRGDVETEE